LSLISILPDLFFQVSGLLSEQCSHLMLSQTTNDGLVIIEEQILSNIPQKMEMANEVRNAWKYLLNRPQNSNTHIVYQCNRITVVVPDTLEKWDEQLFFLRGNFDVIQNQFRYPIHAAKQMRTVTLACSIYMKNISAPFSH